MDWLSQYWLWVALALGAGFYLFRGRPGGLIGMGHGAHAGAGDTAQPDHGTATSVPKAAVDPVGGEAVRTEQALTSAFAGRIYYFASKENRERFEAAPQDFASKAVGYAAEPAARSDDRPRRHGGCG